MIYVKNMIYKTQNLRLQWRDMTPLLDILNFIKKKRFILSSIENKYQ